jgi:hypothetical protein
MPFWGPRGLFFGENKSQLPSIAKIKPKLIPWIKIVRIMAFLFPRRGIPRWGAPPRGRFGTGAGTTGFFSGGDPPSRPSVVFSLSLQSSCPFLSPFPLVLSSGPFLRPFPRRRPGTAVFPKKIVFVFRKKPFSRTGKGPRCRTPGSRAPGQRAPGRRAPEPKTANSGAAGLSPRGTGPRAESR